MSEQTGAPPRRRTRPLVMGFAMAATLAGAVKSAGAQTDYYNTDAGRPITVEDAYPVERRAFELQLAPLRLERAAGGVYTWTIEPEVAYGILPRTHVEVGVPIAYQDIGIGTGRTTTGIAGIELGVFHNLNTETSLPALAVAAEALLPVGHLAPDEVWVSAKGIVTRTFPWARFHANGQYTFGDEPDAGVAAGTHAISRWMAGLAVDRTFALRSMLVTAEVVTRQPIHEEEDLAWDVAAGLRYQWDPRIAVDAGIGRQLTGDARAWSITFGAAYALGMPWRQR